MSQVSGCSQNPTPIHHKVPCEDMPVNSEAWLEPSANGAVRQSDSCTQLTSPPHLLHGSCSSSSSRVPSESYLCRQQSAETATDIFGDALQTENQTDALGKNWFLDYVNSSSIIQHFRDMQIQKMSSYSRSVESLPSGKPVSPRSSPKRHRHLRPVPLPRKMHSMQELPVITPPPRSQYSQLCGKAPSQSWSSGQLVATGRGGTLETTSLGCLDKPREDLGRDSGLGVDTPEIPAPERQASTEDLLDKIELWIPEWRKEEYLSAQKKCKKKHRVHSGRCIESPERLQVSHEFGCVRDRGSDSEDDNSPRSPVYLDILSDFPTGESLQGTSSPRFSSVPLPNATHNEELTSPQSYPTNCTRSPTASLSSPSLADRPLFPPKSLSSPLSSKNSPRVESSTLSSTPTLPFGHPPTSLPFTTHSELTSLDFTFKRARSHDPTNESSECTCSQLAMLEGSGSQQSSPRHKLLYDGSPSFVKAGSGSPDSLRSGHANGPEASTRIHARLDYEQGLPSYSLSSVDEQEEDSETMCSTHVDEPLYSSIASANFNHECALDLSIQSDDYYARPDEVLTAVTPGTVGLLPLGEVIDPYCHVSEDQLRDLASRPPAVPPSRTPRTSPEKSPDRSKARNC